MATLKTLPKSAPRLDGGVLAHCWLAAGAAGVKARGAGGDRRLDRGLLVASYVDTAGRKAGLAFVGVSYDLVVVASMPFYQSSVGPQGLWDLMLAGEPEWCVGVNDVAMGADRMRKIAAKAAQVEGEGGKLWCTLTLQTVQAEGTLGDVGAMPYFHLAVDGMTEGDLIPQASYAPIDWTQALPGTAKPTIPPSPLMLENPSAFERLGRIARHLPVQQLGWEIYTLPSTDRTVRYVKLETDNATFEVTEAIGLVPGQVPTIFDPPRVQVPGEEQLPDDESDEAWEAGLRAVPNDA